MNPIDYVILVVLALVLGGVLLFIHRQKKKGIKCMGCPSGATCGGKCAGCSGNCCGKGH